MSSTVLKGSCDMTQSYIGRAKRHLAVRVQVHLSGKSGRSAIHAHISSCKGCHSCSISNIYTLAQANTDLEVNIKEAIYIYKYILILNNKIYQFGSSFHLNILLSMHCIY